MIKKFQNGVKLEYDDVSIVPAASTPIHHRKECDCKVDGMYPVWTAPMSTVISLKNWKVFRNSGINCVIPRSEKIEDRVKFTLSHSDCAIGTPFVAYSLEEINNIFLCQDTKSKMSKCVYNYLSKSSVDSENETSGKKICVNVCIDIANGHMEDEIDAIKKLKEKWGSRVCVMGGNIANPLAYNLYDDAGADYVRVGIGGGCACITSSNTGVYYPLFSLVKECYENKLSRGGHCKIIADGGIRSFRDIQKALLYADAVMIGSLFNKAIESAGKTTYGRFYWNVRGLRILRPFKTLLKYGKTVKPSDYEKVVKLIKNGKLTVFKEFYGMSTKKAQKMINDNSGKTSTKLKTSEGKVMTQPVEYSVEGWISNAMDFLRSAMSYTASRNLEEYKDSDWVILNSIKYNK